MTHDRPDCDIPRDAFGDELDEPPLWESVLLLLSFPFYLLGRAVGPLLPRRFRAARHRPRQAHTV